MENGIVKEEKTTINNSTSIVGNIKANEHLIINGTIKGNVEIRDYNLFLGAAGRIEGEVHAQNVKIRGHMKGDILATGKVEITKKTIVSTPTSTVKETSKPKLSAKERAEARRKRRNT